MELTELAEHEQINAIVYMGQLGMEGGRALAAILTGEASPSGKLAVTWARAYADVPFSDEFGPYAQDAERAEYKEGIYAGYKYFDAFGVAPLFPFGFGRSYTEFFHDYVDASIEKDCLHVRVRISNTGKDYAGKESVQLYASCPGISGDGEEKRLVAFEKTELLPPGQAQTLSLSVPFSYLTSYDEARAETVLDAGDYIFLVGSSSETLTPVVLIHNAERQVLAQHKQLCAPSRTITQLHHKPVPKACKKQRAILSRSSILLSTIRKPVAIQSRLIWTSGHCENYTSKASRSSSRRLRRAR